MLAYGDSVYGSNGGILKRAGRVPGKRSILGGRASSGIRSGFSAFGMALGYLGLVAILSMAPYWHQAIAPHPGQPLVCTESGGSR